MDITGKADRIRELLGSARTIAVVGASPNPERPSNEIARYLVETGYEMIPVNPGQVGDAVVAQDDLAAQRRVDDVTCCAPHDHVSAAAAVDGVDTADFRCNGVHSGNHVGGIAMHIAIVAEDHVVSAEAEDAVISGGAAQRVVAGVADDRVEAGRAGLDRQGA